MLCHGTPLLQTILQESSPGCVGSSCYHTRDCCNQSWPETKWSDQPRCFNPSPWSVVCWSGRKAGHPGQKFESNFLWCNTTTCHLSLQHLNDGAIFGRLHPYQASHSNGWVVASKKKTLLFQEKSSSCSLISPWLIWEGHRADPSPLWAELQALQPARSPRGWSRRPRWSPRSQKELLLDKPSALPEVEVGQSSACPIVSQLASKELPPWGC